MPPISLDSSRYSIVREPDLDTTSGGKQRRHLNSRRNSARGRVSPRGHSLWHALLETVEEGRCMPGLLIEGVSKSFRQGRQSLLVLQPLDLEVAQGEFVSLIGPSGCGKSTLFNIIAGLEQADSGSLSINGDASSRRTGKTGYMPQQPLLLPWRTVEENVLLGLDVRRVPRRQALERARELLKHFGLADFAQHYPATLSGGMRQRVALLRTV